MKETGPEAKRHVEEADGVLELVSGASELMARKVFIAPSIPRRLEQVQDDGLNCLTALSKKFLILRGQGAISAFESASCFCGIRS